jgi:hypothetical protein
VVGASVELSIHLYTLRGIHHEHIYDTWFVCFVTLMCDSDKVLQR